MLLSISTPQRSGEEIQADELQAGFQSASERDRVVA